MNDIVLTQKRISNRHCRIYRVDQKPGDWRDGGAEPVVYIEDQNSSNGTWASADKSFTSNTYTNLGFDLLNR